MKPRAAVTPIALVVLAGGTAAYAYLVDRGTISDADRAARRSDVFPSFRVDEVKRIELDHGAEATVLEREPEAGANGAPVWTMTSPRHETADGAAVDQLLRELELASRLRDVDPSEAAGVDAPRVRGSITVGPLDYRFALGADAPRPEGAAYMKLDGEGTFVVGRSLKVQLLRTADAYRDHTVIPYGEADLASVEVRDAAGGFALERHGTTFRIADSGLRASRTAVERLFAALADARADSFPDDARADAATTPPAFTVRLAPRGDGRKPVELRVGGRCPGEGEDVAVVRTAPTRVSACVARAILDALQSVRTTLVDESPLYAHADEIEELRLERLGGGAGARVEIARRGTGWHERAPEDRDLGADETESANALAHALAAARGTGAHRARADQPFAAAVRATVVRTGGGITEVVELATPGPDGSVLARRVDDGAVLRLTADVARRFAPHPVALRPRGIWRPPFDPGAVVAIDDTCGPVPEHLLLDDRVWKLRSPAGFAADPLSAADLAGAMVRAKADAWIDEKDDGTFGFGKPGACSVTLGLESAGDAGPARRATLLFGADADGGTYARTQDDPAVFVAPKVLRELVAHPAIDRGRFRLDLGSLTSVTLLRGSARRTLGHDSENDKLASAIGGLYALSALHPGAPAAAEGFDRPTLEIDASAGPDAAAATPTRIVVGAPTVVDGVDAYFARTSDVNATFAVPHNAVGAILDAW